MWMKDRPILPGRGNNAEQVFESAALAVEGRQAGSYMGSVEWGWRVDAAGKFARLPLTLKSKDVPSSGFMNAAKAWNSSTVAGTTKTSADPTNVDEEWIAENLRPERPRLVRARMDRIG